MSPHPDPGQETQGDCASMTIRSQTEAQQRADRIDSFRAELAALETDRIVTLPEETRQAIDRYHTGLLAELAVRFDIDTGLGQKRLSLGMKIASFLGALGLAASVFLLFYQYWGRLATTVQVGILLAAPMLGLAVTMYAARERSGYFAKLAGMVTFACAVLNLSVLGQIFNITPSPNAFLVWAGFALLLAYAANARLLLAAGILCLGAYLSARTGTWGGCYWLDFGKRPEHFLPTAALLFAVSLLPQRSFGGFAPLQRVFALLFLFLPMLVLANWVQASYLPLDNSTVEAVYQTAGFLVSALAIWAGIRLSWPEVVNTRNVFFTIFLYTKFFDWWWDWMPKYLFFLIIGLSSILMLLVFKRLRQATATREDQT
jgi:uncharacterized membrane protein